MSTESVTETYVSRQPIYCSKMDVYGYELLFRNSGAMDRAVIVDGDQATAQVILNFIEIDLEQIVGCELAFINLTRHFILEGHCASLPNDRVVLEVLEDITADPEIVESLQKLSRQGYIIALDDFLYDESLRPMVSCPTSSRSISWVSTETPWSSRCPRSGASTSACSPKKSKHRKNSNSAMSLVSSISRGFSSVSPS